jgi:uncharacterized protein YkwD
MKYFRGKPLALSLLSVLSICWFATPQGIAQPLSNGSASESSSYQSDNLVQFQQIALDLANRDRVQNGLSPLQADTLLTQAAQLHAEDMLRRNYFSHHSPEGKSPSDRFADVGGRQGAAENIVMIQGSSGLEPDRLVYFEEQWMKSTGHRENLLNSKYARFGYGVASSGGRIFAVQLFTFP